ncbi:hypothetical protein AB0F93_24670, partial [Micromonospora tulbaghiae]|uniref:hypothetical protein n=1 Tax=Micromonospora tulbaghiae TaxID=479978 RepID=UPI0033C1084E
LRTGARLVLAKPGGHKDAGYLRDLLVSERSLITAESGQRRERRGRRGSGATRAREGRAGGRSAAAPGRNPAIMRLAAGMEIESAVNLMIVQVGRAGLGRPGSVIKGFVSGSGRWEDTNPLINGESREQGRGDRKR